MLSLPTCFFFFFYSRLSLAVLVPGLSRLCLHYTRREHECETTGSFWTLLGVNIRWNITCSGSAPRSHVVVPYPVNGCSFTLQNYWDKQMCHCCARLMCGCLKRCDWLWRRMFHISSLPTPQSRVCRRPEGNDQVKCPSFSIFLQVTNDLQSLVSLLKP